MTRRFSQLLRSVVHADPGSDLVEYRRRLNRRVVGEHFLFEPDGSDFDGTNDFLIGNNFFGGAKSSKLGTLSFWVKPHAHALNQSALFSESLLFGVALRAAGTFDVQGAAAGPTTALAIFSTPNTLTDEVWQWVGVSWDLNVPISHMFLRRPTDFVDVDVNDHNTEVDVSILYTAANSAQDKMTIGATASPGAEKVNAGFAEFYFAIDQYLDFSVKSNRRKFVTRDLRPVYLGPLGIRPTGFQPDIYSRGDSTDFLVNLGTGPNWSEQGALADIAFTPGGG